MDSQSLLYRVGRKVEEWGWENLSRRCLNRSCLWTHKKGLLSAYLDFVNKTKDKIGLISLRLSQCIITHICTHMTKHFSAAERMNKYRA